MRHSLWLIVSLMGVRVDGEKEEFDLVPSGCCDWPSCYDPRTQVIQKIWNPLNTWTATPDLSCFVFRFSFALTPADLCGPNAPPSSCSSAATASKDHFKLEMPSCWPKHNRMLCWMILFCFSIKTNPTPKQSASRYMSPFGALPAQCFPDALPHLEIIQEKGLVGTEEQVPKNFNRTKHCSLFSGERENPQADECEDLPSSNWHLPNLKSTPDSEQRRNKQEYIVLHL